MANNETLSSTNSDLTLSEAEPKSDDELSEETCEQQTLPQRISERSSPTKPMKALSPRAGGNMRATNSSSKKRASLCIVPTNKSSPVGERSPQKGVLYPPTRASVCVFPASKGKKFVPEPLPPSVPLAQAVSVLPPGDISRSRSRSVSPKRPRMRIKGASPSPPTLEASNHSPWSGSVSPCHSNTVDQNSSFSSSVSTPIPSSLSAPSLDPDTDEENKLDILSVAVARSSESLDQSVDVLSFARTSEPPAMDLLSYARSPPTIKDEDDNQHVDEKDKKKKKSSLLGGKKKKRRKEGGPPSTKSTRGSTISDIRRSRIVSADVMSDKLSGAVGFMQFLEEEDLPGFVSEDESASIKAPPQETVIYFPLPSEKELPKKKKDSNPTDLSETWTVGTYRILLNEEELDLRIKKIPEIKAGSLEVLIYTLCHPTNSTKKFRRSFLLMCRTFVEPQDLLDLLISRYSPCSMGKMTDVREKVVDVISQWQREYYEEDWEGNEPLLNLYKEFLDELEGGVVRQNAEFGRLLANNYQEARMHASQRKVSQLEKLTKFQEDSSLEVDESLSFGSFSEEEIANTLTCYGEFIFKQIRDREYLAWLKGKVKEDFQNLEKAVGLFNLVSTWVSTELVTKPKLVDRVEAVEKFVRIAGLCFELNNFCVSMAITSGVNNSCVSRMKKTFAAISPGCKTLLTDLEQKFSHSKNFRNYRALMDSVAPPAIPYLGMYQKDILFLDDGNPSTVQSLVNWSKRTKMAESICDVAFCQKGEFRRGVTCDNKFLSWFLNKSPSLSEKDLFFWSRRVDPKDSEMVICEFIQGEMECLTRIRELENSVAEMALEIERLKSGEKQKEEKKSTPPLVSQMSTTNMFSERKTLTTPRLTKRKNRSSGNPMFDSAAALPVFRLEQGLAMSQDARQWSVDRVSAWVEKEFGEECAAAFEENQILGGDLVEMKAKDLRLIVDDDQLCQEIANKVKVLAKLGEVGREEKEEEGEGAGGAIQSTSREGDGGEKKAAEGELQLD